MDEQTMFGVVDQCIFAGVLIISAVIGLYISYKGSKSPEEFLMGKRSLNSFAVSVSLLTSYVSAMDLMGYSGEVYASGMQISTIALGAPFGILFSAYFLLPVLYPLKLTSINEYIELRFKSKRLRFVMFLLTMTKILTLNGISLYAPTIALSSITNLSTLNGIFILGIICTLYSSFGGIKAVVWTDVFQFFMMIIGMVAVMVVGCVQNGGVLETFHKASEGGRLEIINMDPSPLVRHTLLNTIAAGFFIQLRLYSSEQVYVQRIGSVKSIKHARRMLTYNIIGKLLMYFLLFTCGLITYATFAGCDPMALGKIKKKDQIVPYFVVDKLRFIPGLPGLFVAAIIGGSLSTLSSMINVCVALLWKDVCLNFSFFKDSSPTSATLINKILSMVIGVILIGLAIQASNARGLMELLITITGTITGPSLGVFMIGYFLPKCNIKGVWTGFIGSTALMLWLSLGGMLHKKPTKMLPFSADECAPLNISSAYNSSVQETISYTLGTNIDDANADTSFINSFYQISYTLYGIIGPVFCILLAVVVSFITGNQKSKEVSPKYVSPYVHKFYWTKEELYAIRERENKLETELSHFSDL